MVISHVGHQSLDWELEFQEALRLPAVLRFDLKHHLLIQGASFNESGMIQKTV